MSLVNSGIFQNKRIEQEQIALIMCC